MKPPICCICDKELEPSEGGLVYFKKRDSDIEWDKKVEEELVGHPPYAEWFCDLHYQKAKDLAHLTIDEALKRF